MSLSHQQKLVQWNILLHPPGPSYAACNAFQYAMLSKLCLPLVWVQPPGECTRSFLFLPFMGIKCPGKPLSWSSTGTASSLDHPWSCKPSQKEGEERQNHSIASPTSPAHGVGQQQREEQSALVLRKGAEAQELLIGGHISLHCPPCSAMWIFIFCSYVGSIAPPQIVIDPIENHILLMISKQNFFQYGSRDPRSLWGLGNTKAGHNTFN